MMRADMAFITTERGTKIETLEVAGHSTPYLYRGWVHLHLVVQGTHCEPWQIQKDQYDKSFHTLSESDFWEELGAQALMNQQSLEEYRAGKWNAG
jgi:hypothetical protein